MRKHLYIGILGKLSKGVSEERDLISKFPVICCDFVSYFKYLLPPPHFVFAVLYSFSLKGFPNCISSKYHKTQILSVPEMNLHSSQGGLFFVSEATVPFLKLFPLYDGVGRRVVGEKEEGEHILDRGTVSVMTQGRTCSR